MKTQAWGWLVAGVLAAGLNASYHDGGLQWAHRVTEQVEHGSTAVLALATGNADRFLSEARLVVSRNEARNETASCPLTTSLMRVQTMMARSENGFAHFEGMTARQEAQLARLEANRDRMEAQIVAQTARIRIPAVAFNPIVVRVPQVRACPRIRVNIPRAPMVRIPAPVIDLESGTGPI